MFSFALTDIAASRVSGEHYDHLLLLRKFNFLQVMTMIVTDIKWTLSGLSLHPVSLNLHYNLISVLQIKQDDNGKLYYYCPEVK